MSEYQIRTVEDLYRHSRTLAPTVRLDMKDLTAGGQQLAVLFGGAFNQLRLTKTELVNRYTILRPDGVANNADNIAAGFVNQAYLGEPAVWGNPTPIQ